MYAGFQREEPHQRAAQQVGQQGHDAEDTIQGNEQHPDGQGAGKIRQRDARRIKDGNDDDRAQVVNDRKCDDQDFQGSGNSLSEQRQHPKGKRNVRGHRNADAGLRWRARIEREMNERRGDDSAKGRNKRKQGVLDV